jgi:hypothetical protein
MYPPLGGTETGMAKTRSLWGIVGMITAKPLETIDAQGRTIVGSGMNVGNVTAVWTGTQRRMKILDGGEMMESGTREWPQDASPTKYLKRTAMHLATDVGLLWKTATAGRSATTVTAELVAQQTTVKTEKTVATVTVRGKKNPHGWTPTFPSPLASRSEARVRKVNSTGYRRGRRV